MSSRALIYCRQSLTREEDSLSLAFQDRACRDLAAREGWTVVEPVIHDPDVRGNDPNRPGIAELFDRIGPDRADVVIVYALSRFARDNILQETLWRRLHAQGVRLVSATEPHAEDDLVRGILGVVSQAERRRMGRFLASSFAERARRGLPHGRVPFGYVKGPDGRLLVDPDAAAIVRAIADQLETGASLWRVARDLNATRAGGRRWEPNTVRIAVTGYAVAGGVACGDVVEWDTHEPILDRDRWQCLRDYLASRRPSRSKGAHSWLEGLIDCGCGAPMHLVTNRPAGRPAYAQFRCSAANRPEALLPRGMPPCDHRPRSIVQDRAEAATLEALTRDLGRLVDADAVYRRALAAYQAMRASAGQELTRLERQRDRLRVERDRLLAIYRRGSLDVNRWETEDRTIGDQLAAIENDLARYGAAPDPGPFADQHAAIDRLRVALAVDPSQARRVLLHTGARVRRCGQGPLSTSAGPVRIVWPDEIAAFLRL